MTGSLPASVRHGWRVSALFAANPRKRQAGIGRNRRLLAEQHAEVPAYYGVAEEEREQRTRQQERAERYDASASGYALHDAEQGAQRYSQEEIANKPNQFLVKSYPLTYEDSSTPQQELGTLIITASLSSIYDKLWDRALFIASVQGAKTLLIALFILWLVHTLLTRHIDTIAQYTRQLNLENLKTPLRLRRMKVDQHEDELDNVVNAINHMREFGEDRRVDVGRAVGVDRGRPAREDDGSRVAGQHLRKAGEGKIRNVLARGEFGIAGKDALLPCHLVQIVIDEHHHEEPGEHDGRESRPAVQPVAEEKRRRERIAEQALDVVVPDVEDLEPPPPPPVGRDSAVSVVMSCP